MSDIKKQFGRNVKYYREKSGLTQEQLAEKLDVNGRSLSFIECGTNFVSAQMLEKLCKVLKVKPKQLFDFEFCPNSAEDTKTALNNLIANNQNKIDDIYKLLSTFLSL